MEADKLNEIKSLWSRLHADNEALREANRRLSAQLSRHRVSTLQSRFSRRFIFYCLMALVLTLSSPILVTVLDFPVWMAVVYGGYGLIMFTLNTLLKHYIDAYNLSLMPVAEALLRATKIKIHYQQTRLIGFATCVPVLIGFFYCITDDPYMYIGAGIGLCVGFSIGITRLLTDLRYTRKIIDSVNGKNLNEGVADE